MQHELVVVDGPEALAGEAASWVAAAIKVAVSGDQPFRFAVSGGRTPWAMFSLLTRRRVPWGRVQIFQVDERVAPRNDPDRNLTHLLDCLGDTQAKVRAMPVEETDLDAAAASYEKALPAHFDLVHLGLGPDGHTASLVPGDPVLDVTDRLVATTDPYQGRRRMTLTYPGLARAEQLLWLVSGAEKANALARLIAGDRSIPAGRVQAGRSVILADADAAAKVPTESVAK